MYGSRATFEANAVALKFAERIIEQTELVKYLIERENRGKKYILDELSQRGYETKDGLGNYIFIKTHKMPSEVAGILKGREKILVKTFSSPLLKDYIVVSVGSEKAMRFFVEKYLEIDC